MRTVFLALPLLFALAADVAAQSTSGAGCSTGSAATTWTCHELTFNAGQVYDHPVRDVSISVAYTLSGQEPVVVQAFWDGGSTYRARVALPVAGRWSYDVSSSDPSSLADGLAGTIDVASYAGDNPFQARGWLATSENQRFLTHADGTPFFWLGDTAWEMATESTPAQVEAYIADRRAKGFTVVQIVTSTHFGITPDHTRNRLGEPYVLDQDLSRPNPRYFDHLDSIVQQANDAGMTVALVPLWAYFSLAHEESTLFDRYYTIDEAVAHAEYVGARYAGSNVCWFIGGDQPYNTDEKRAYWDTFARALDAAGGGRQLFTVHPSGYSGSFQYWPDAPDWLDFHSYQASHISDLRYLRNNDGSLYSDEYGALFADGSFSWTGALRGYHGFYQDEGETEVLPILNVEANYEDIFSRLWERSDLRVDANAVRQVAYWGLLSGSNVGFSYGANGVWSWSNDTPNPNGRFGIRYVVEEALSFPGSSHMTVLRAFAEAHDWHKWEPRPDLVEETDTEHFVASAAWGNRVVAYAPSGTRTFRLTPVETAESEFVLTWTNPISGETSSGSVSRTPGAPLDLSPPDLSDWLLVVTPRSEVPAQPGPGGLEVAVRGPNPTRGSLSFRVEASEPLDVTVKVFDVLGRTIDSRRLRVGTGGEEVTIPALAAGSYVYRVTYEDRGRPAAVQRVVTVVR